MQKPSFVLPSPELRTDYPIWTEIPETDGAVPLVIVLDGDDQFTPAVEAARTMERDGFIPSLGLVGVGYGGGYRSPLNRRVRDYTPSQPKDEPMESGGAEAFHAFLEKRLVPAVIDRCGFQPLSVGLTGHSLGSLFGLHALFRPQPFFNFFLISSPSIWWNDRNILRSVGGARAADPAHQAKAFLSVGAEDTPSMTGDLTLLETMLKQEPRPDLEYTVERFAGRDHYNVLPPAFRQGFRWLYGTRE